MFLSELKLWNFRKYGIPSGADLNTSKPALTVRFHEGVNVLIGENDSGKTAIIDAIRYVLHTKSGEPIKIDEKDFYKIEKGNRSRCFKIVCIFDGITKDDAALFLEWCGVKGKIDGSKIFTLHVTLAAQMLDDGRIIPRFYAGMGGEGNVMPYDVRSYLNVVYLKPLRDALQDMTHGYKSRLAQILQAHPVFGISKLDEQGKHQLERHYNSLKTAVDGFFALSGNGDGKSITKTLNTTIKDHFLLKTDSKEAVIQLTGNELGDILRQLDLVMEDNKSGLGSLNLLCMAAELLLFSEETRGLKLTLIEELEAHLHPQLQLRLIDYLGSESKYGQFILTTHSITLGSTIPLEHMIVLRENMALAMDKNSTECSDSDYRFLERFLDATKANLFFAKGLILVEGDAENIMIPTIAKIIGKDLHQYGVSIVNVGSTAYKRYVNIFRRKDGNKYGMPVSIISDLDVRSIEYYQDSDSKKGKQIYRITDKIKVQLDAYNDVVNFSAINTFFTSKADMNNFIDRNKRTRTISQKKRESIIQILSQNFENITEADIEALRKERSKKLSGLYNDEIKIFLPKKWTLEYEIANSKLCKFLAEAIELARLEKLGVTIDGAEIKRVKNKIGSKKMKDNDPTTSYQIFKPLNDGTVSKAITAQYFSQLLEDYVNMDELKNLIESDSYLSYIVEAIKHVTR